MVVMALALANGGCIWVAAGAAGGAAAGYAYYQGKVCQTFNASKEDSWDATRTALQELGMPILAEDHKDRGGQIDSQTANGERVRISFDTVPSKIPAEGEVTRVGVRVDLFGDHPVSDRLLDQVGMHLAPRGLQGNPPPPFPNPGIVPAAARTITPGSDIGISQSNPPPLLPLEPVPARPEK
jgi:hypothetical protein